MRVRMEAAWGLMTTHTTAPDDEPVLLLRSEPIGLGPLRRELAPLYQRWMNDLRVVRMLSATTRPVTLDAQVNWLDLKLLGSDPVFTIYELATSRPIGVTDFYDFDVEHGLASLGLLIGATDVWGRGYGTATARLMLDYAFNVLGLHNVQLVVNADNAGALRAYERAGFTRSGVRRGAYRVGRRRYDAIYMDAVADEFPSSEHHVGNLAQAPPRRDATQG
jgi:RimJ/RimL family protein N-acetyltransferase